MGFVVTPNETAGSGSLVSTAASTTSASGLACVMPNSVRDGDLVLAFCASVGAPTTAWTAPAGWSNVVAQKNAASSLAGRVALFSHVYTSGEATSITFTQSANASVVLMLIVRSSVAGGSLVLGNPPSNAFGGTFDSEQTSSVSSWNYPRVAVDHKLDLRIIFTASTGSGTANPNVPTETASADNPGGFVTWMVEPAATQGSSLSATCLQMIIPSITDAAGTTAWTSAVAGKRYSLLFSISDGGVAGPPIGREEDPFGETFPILATGDEHLLNLNQDSLTGRGGGGGISVF